MYGSTSFRGFYLGMGPHYQYYKIYDLESRRIRITPAFVTSENHYLRSPDLLHALLEKWAQSAGDDPSAAAVVADGFTAAAPADVPAIVPAAEVVVDVAPLAGVGPPEDVPAILPTAEVVVDVAPLADDSVDNVAASVPEANVGIHGDDLVYDDGEAMEGVAPDVSVDVLAKLEALNNDMALLPVSDDDVSINPLASVHANGSESHMQQDGTFKWTVDRLGPRSTRDGVDGYTVQWQGNCRDTWQPRAELLEDCPELVAAREAYTSRTGRPVNLPSKFSPQSVECRVKQLSLPVRCTRIESALQRSRLSSIRKARTSATWARVKQELAADKAHLASVQEDLEILRSDLAAAPDIVDFNDVLPFVRESFPHMS